jgi:hypothetical protein
MYIYTHAHIYIYVCIMYIYRGRCLARSAAMPDLCFAGHDGAAGAELAHILKSTDVWIPSILAFGEKQKCARALMFENVVGGSRLSASRLFRKVESTVSAYICMYI